MILGLILILALIMPQGAFAASSSGTDQGEKKIELIRWGGPELARKDSLRIYWGDKTTSGLQYRIAWKMTDSTSWKSVDIDDPEPSVDKPNTYLITGLEPDKKYDIRVSAILKNEKGEEVKTAPLELTGYTYATAPEYQAYSAASDGTYLEATWKVHEKNAVLKFYRADSKDGEYKQVGETDGRQDTDHAAYKDLLGKVIFRDDTVKSGKSYYYKAVSEVTLDDGTVVKAESPRAYNLTSKRKPFGSYKVQLVNKKGTYSKTLTWKLTNDKANYKTKILKSSVLWSRSSKTGKEFSRKITGMQYSYDGKTYYKMKNSLTIQPGKTVYLRTNLKSNLYIRKDGKCSFWMESRYYYNDLNGSGSLYTEHWQNMRLEATGAVKVSVESEGDGSDDEYGEYLENEYKVYHSTTANLKAVVNTEGNAVLSWNLCPYAEEFNLRYGATEEEAMKSKAVKVPKGQFAYEVKGLEKDKDYYFIISETVRDENGNTKENILFDSEILIPSDGWNHTGYTYHSHRVMPGDGDLKTAVIEGKADALHLYWERCGHAKGYKIRYGTSEEEAMKSEPIVISQQWVESHDFENLEKGKTYYFILTELTEDDHGNLLEILRPQGKITAQLPA